MAVTILYYTVRKKFYEGGGSVKINISVRELISFVMRSGSMDRPRASYARLRVGTKIHKLIQDRGGDGYMAEVPLSCDIEYEDIVFSVSGRADGIISDEKGYTVDEIKSISRSPSGISPEDYPEYEAQADIYAYMLTKLYGACGVTVRLTFVSVESLESESYGVFRTAKELEERVFSLLSRYYRFAKLMADGAERFTSSAGKLKFPHKTYREGQQDIILDTFRSIKKGGKLFVQAPTGIGKTLSVCYGAVKAVGEGCGRRIFYFTPKSTVGEAPIAAFNLMRQHGLSARVITLTAKERMCHCKERVHDCASDVCPYSNGHYDRVNDALFELLSNHADITAENVAEIAKKHVVCPYELSLDAALFCDVIICDCNYLFDPRVYLRRFFDEGCDKDGSIALVDEAHDLIDRAREMYSADISSSDLTPIGSLIPESDFILYLPLKHLTESLAEIRGRCIENEYFDGEEQCGTLLCDEPFKCAAESAAEFFAAAMSWLRVNGSGAADVPCGAHTLEFAVREAAFSAKRFADACARADSRFVHLAKRRGERVEVRAICIDPSALLSERMKRVRCTVLFSATMKPMDYFTDLLGGKGAQTLTLPSPFDRSQMFSAIMHKISLRYADRERTLSSVIEIIDTVVNARLGNYMVFLPSYEMLRQVVHAYRRYDPYADICVQKPDMSLRERAAFLAKFKDDGAVIGFAVLGGMFSESIDLAGEKLIGAIVVGTGLARLNLETNIIADYFTKTREAGFEYAYLYPAMNKVLQAVGRVIRTESDHGVCILIDDRYATPQYSRLLCDHIRDIHLVGNEIALSHALDEFWEGEE